MLDKKEHKLREVKTHQPAEHLSTASSSSTLSSTHSLQEPSSAAISPPMPEDESQDSINIAFHYYDFLPAERERVTDFFSIVEAGNVEAVKELVKQGMPLNIMDDMDRTPLSVAIKAGDLQMVEFLLSTPQGLAMINGEDSFCNPLLYIAIERRHFEIVLALLKTKEGRATIGWTDRQGCTSLLVATRISNFRIVAALLETPEGRAIVSKDNNFGETPLYIAQKNQDVAIASALKGASRGLATSQILPMSLPIGNDAEWIWQRDLMPAQRIVFETLFSAVDKGDTETVQHLIKDRTLLKAKNIARQTLLHAAASKSHVALTKLLLNTDVGNQFLTERDASGSTPLLDAIAEVPSPVDEERLLKTVQLLLRTPEGCAMLNLKYPYRTPLHSAVSRGYIETARFLLTIPEGLDTVNRADGGDGHTPLVTAALKGNLDMGVLLLAHEADFQVAERYLASKKVFSKESYEGDYGEALVNLERIRERYKSEVKQSNNTIATLKESKQVSVSIKDASRQPADTKQQMRIKLIKSGVEAFEHFKMLLNQIHQPATGQVVQTHSESKIESKDSQQMNVTDGVQPVELIVKTPFQIMLIRAVKLLLGFYQYPGMIRIICNIIFLKGTVDKVSALEPIRKELRAIMLNLKNEAIKNGAMTLCDAAHQALLELAHYLPLNEDDDMGEPIRNHFRIFVSTGYQFDVWDLTRWHRKRKRIYHTGVNGEKIGEKDSGKLLLNYYLGTPGTPFDDRDWHHVVRSAVARDISILDLQQRPEPVTVPLSPEESVCTEEITQALIAIRLIEQLTETSAAKLLNAENSQEICQLIVSLHKVQEFTPAKFTALMTNPLYRRGLSWGLAMLGEMLLCTPSHQKLFLQQDPVDIFLLAYALDVLQEEGKRIQAALQEEEELPHARLQEESGLTQTTFERLFKYAKGLVRALTQLQLTNKMLTANFLMLFEQAEYADGFAQCLEILATVKPITQSNVSDLLRLAPYTPALAFCLKILQKGNMATLLTVGLLLEKARHADGLAQCLGILLTIKDFPPAGVVNLLKQAQHAKSLALCLKILQAMGVSDPRIFITVVENAPFSAGLAQGLSVLQKRNGPNAKIFDILLQHMPLADSLGQILDSLQKGDLLDKDNKNIDAALAHVEQIEDLGNVLFFLQEADVVLTQGVFNFLLKNAEKLVYVSNILRVLLNINHITLDNLNALFEQMVYVEDLSIVLDSFYEVQSVDQKTVNTLLKHSYYLQDLSEELACLQTAGVVLTPHMCAGLLKQFHHWEAWHSTFHYLYDADLLTQERFVSLLEHSKDIQELNAAFACLKSFDKLLSSNVAVLLRHSQHAINLAKALKILYDAKLLPAIPAVREALAAQAQYIDNLLPILTYLQDNASLDYDNVCAVLAQAQHAEVLVNVLQYFQKKDPLNPQIFMAVFVAQAPYVDHFIAGITHLQAEGIADEENQAALMQHIAQADDLAQALISLHRAGIPPSESRPKLLKCIQHIESLSQGLISLQLAGALDQQTFLMLLVHSQYAAGLGQALACLHRAGISTSLNRDALLAHVQHIDSISQGMTYLQRRSKLTPITLAALLEQPHRAASLGQELAGAAPKVQKLTTAPIAAPRVERETKETSHALPQATQNGSHFQSTIPMTFFSAPLLAVVKSEKEQTLGNQALPGSSQSNASSNQANNVPSLQVDMVKRLRELASRRARQLQGGLGMRAPTSSSTVASLKRAEVKGRASSRNTVQRTSAVPAGNGRPGMFDRAPSTLPVRSPLPQGTLSSYAIPDNTGRLVLDIDF